MTTATRKPTMSATATATAPARLPRANAIRRLPPALVPLVRDYVNAVTRKKIADAEARSADSQAKAIRAKLLHAMGDAPAVAIGNAVLTTKAGSDSPSTLTLSDGSRILWSSVVSVLVGNRTIPAQEVTTLFGGRANPATVEVTGTP